MSRESLNITVTESLRKAQLRERLAGIATHTGMTATQIAGRALTIGLGRIEGDLRLIFPGQAPTSAAIPCTVATSAAPTSTAIEHNAQPSAATQSADTQCTANAATAQPDTAKRTEPPPRWLPTADAAAAVGYGSASALLMHGNRHPEILTCSRREGRCRLWDVAKLRAIYERNGWQPR